LPDLYGIVILFFVGTIASFINVNAGGGSTLTLPALIFLGVDPVVANGTNRLSILFQNASAVYSFKQENFYELKDSLILSALTLPGAILGALFAVKLEDKIFQNILAVVMIFVVITMLLPKKKENQLNKKIKLDWKTVPALIAVGFYGGFVQAGVGFLLMAVLQNLMKLNLIRVNMHKVFIVFFYTVPAFLIFVLTTKINWYYGFTLSVGTAFGAWWAVKLSIKKGEGFIKLVLIIAILIMAFKLLNIF
jgi:uncharacterized membrane protein YfcA